MRVVSRISKLATPPVFYHLWEHDVVFPAAFRVPRTRTMPELFNLPKEMFLDIAGMNVSAP